MTAMSRHRQRAFTLLEVLVAIAILGLGLTVILGSQVGLFTNASRGQHLTVATNLARCKMGEIEVRLLKMGYQLTDESDDGPAGDGGLDLGPIGMLAGINQPGGAALNAKSNPKDLAKTLGNAPSPMSIAPMMMGMVYPTLKPMLEASIRKVSVTVSYKEGKFQRELLVTQYVTNPQQGQLDPTVMGSGGVPGFGLPNPGGGLPGPTGLPGTGTGTQGFGLPGSGIAR